MAADRRRHADGSGRDPFLFDHIGIIDRAPSGFFDRVSPKISPYFDIPAISKPCPEFREVVRSYGDPEPLVKYDYDQASAAAG
jgi:hypothetical protein